MSDILTDEQIAELERWLEIANQPYQAKLKAAKAHAQYMVTQSVPALLRRLLEAEREREEAEQEVEELKTNADEYEKECTKALFAIANACNYEWDGDGATADDLREHISTTLEECTKNELPLLEKIRVIERERAHLAGELVRLKTDNARQRKIGAVQSLREAAGTLGVQKPVGGPSEAGWDVCIEIVRDMAELLEKEAGDE